MKRKIVSMFNEYREAYGGVAAPVLAGSNSSYNGAKKAFDINKWRFGNIKKREDELTRFLNAPLLVLESQKANDEFDVLEWWNGNSKEWPTLAQIAFEIYYIPAMSIEPEQVFSGYVPLYANGIDIRCKLTITNLRNRLSTESVEAVECLHSWLGGGLLSNVMELLSRARTFYSLCDVSQVTTMRV